MEEEKSMLQDQDSPMHLWVEAAMTTGYVHNHTSHQVLDNKTSEEDF